MKIMFAITSLAKGGAERCVCNLSNEFQINGNDVHILNLIENTSEYTFDERTTFSFLCENKEEKNVSFKLLHYIKMIRKTVKEIKRIKPDVVIAFLPSITFYTIIASKICKVPIIVSVRNDPKAIYKNKLDKIILKYIYPKADGFVFQTEQARDFFCEKIRAKSTIIHNPLNEDFIVKPFCGKREKTIVNVGRLHKQKNQKLLIEAFSKLPSKYNDYKLIIYGEGELKETLQNYIEKMSLTDRVCLAGKVDNLQSVMYKASMFVLSSDYEGLPNSLMEAMALGIPSISTDCPCGGPKVLIEDGVTGLLTQVGNSEMLKDKMVDILNDDVDVANMSIRANKYIVDNFNTKSINEKWIKYINSFINIKGEM